MTSKTGQRYSDDMIATTGNAACSIALRNAAFRVIPLALVKPVYEAAKRLAIGDGKSLVQRRSACVAHFGKLGVPVEKVCAVVNVRSADDIQLEQLEVLMGYATAIKDGESSVDEVFAQKEEKAPAPKFSIPPASPVETEPSINYVKYCEQMFAQTGTTAGQLMAHLSQHGHPFYATLDVIPVEVMEKLYDSWPELKGGAK